MGFVLGADAVPTNKKAAAQCSNYTSAMTYDISTVTEWLMASLMVGLHVIGTVNEQNSHHMYCRHYVCLYAMLVMTLNYICIRPSGLKSHPEKGVIHKHITVTDAA